MTLRIEIENTFERQRKKFTKHNPRNTQALTKTLRLFTENPRHPSLSLEKLSGSDIWTIRINKSDRIFFLWVDAKTVLLIDVGEHDRYRQY